jgi:hypothetical protein
MSTPIFAVARLGRLNWSDWRVLFVFWQTFDNSRSFGPTPWRLLLLLASRNPASSLCAQFYGAPCELRTFRYASRLAAGSLDLY